MFFQSGSIFVIVCKHRTDINIIHHCIVIKNIRFKYVPGHLTPVKQKNNDIQVKIKTHFPQA